MCRQPVMNHIKSRKMKGAVNYVALLKSCAKKKDLYNGSKIHEVLRKRGLVKKDIFVGCTLLNMYANCGLVAKAQEVFDEFLVQDVVSWTALIDAYVQLGHDEEALHGFERMQGEGVSPNAVTFLCIVKACSNMGAVKKGDEFYARTLTQGFFQEKPELGNAIVDMYAKFGALVKAKQVFNELPTQTVVSWNTLIAGYAQHGYGKEALACFDQMHADGISHNAVTFLSALKACNNVEAIEKGMEIHAEVVRRSFSSNMDLGNTLVDMYVKCGTLVRAQQVFDELLVRTVVSWNVLISGYAQLGLGEEALNHFEEMQEEGLQPDAVTYLCILKVCGSIGAAEKGEGIHAEIVRQKMLECNQVLGNALVDMHAKCGALEKAQQVFAELPTCNVVTWTALLAGYVQAGDHNTMFSLFYKMIQEGIRPNMVTFVVLLSACSHSIAMDEGQSCFEVMSFIYGISPTLEHHTCMVDLLSRAGCFDRAIIIVNKFPLVDYLPAWLAFLGACREWGNIKFGGLAFEHVLRLDKTSSIAYAYMCDIYTVSGMQEEANQIKALRIFNEGKRPQHLGFGTGRNMTAMYSNVDG